MLMHYHENLKHLAKENENFRQVVFTGKYAQLVLMSLMPSEEIGEEVHDDVDQFFYFVSGKGEAVVGGESKIIEKGDGVFIPAGTLHNIKNIDVDDPLKLFTLYSPPNHPDGKIHKTKAKAEEDHY
jgi:mannose-6-phosphate isomerase-like protein (cupin superfamily)